MINTISPFRWYLKKMARKSLARGSWGSGLLNYRAHTAGARALTYHRFGNTTRDPFCVPQKAFADQMAYIADNDLAISFADLESFLNGKTPLKNDSVLVTIDDGFHSLYSQALPVLRDYNIPAVAFITASLIAHNDNTCGPRSKHAPEPYLSWQEVMELADSGITIGSHAWTHRSLGTLTVEESKSEAMRSKETLERHLDQPVTGFAYPFGTRADFNSATKDTLERCGYRCAFTSQHGKIRAGMDPLTLPRIKVEGGEGVGTFRLLVHGGLDAWQLIDRMFWRFQASDNG